VPSPPLRPQNECDSTGLNGIYRKDVTPTDHAIRLAREQAERGLGYRTGQFNDNMREYFGLVGDEVRKKLLEILDEVPPECYEPPYELSLCQ